MAHPPPPYSLVVSYGLGFAAVQPGLLALSVDRATASQERPWALSPQGWTSALGRFIPVGFVSQAFGFTPHLAVAALAGVQYMQGQSTGAASGTGHEAKTEPAGLGPEWRSTCRLSPELLVRLRLRRQNGSPSIWWEVVRDCCWAITWTSTCA